MPQRETRTGRPAGQAGRHPGACNTWLVGVPAGVWSRAPWPEVLGSLARGPGRRQRWHLGSAHIIQGLVGT